MLPKLNTEKAAHIAMLFLQRSGGNMEIFKLMKLMYLAERESIRLHGTPVTYDQFVSMKNGPLLSGVYDLAKGEVENAFWSKLISPRQGNVLSLLNSEEPLSLSESEIDIVNAVYDQFGSLTGGELWKKVHDVCTEWTNPEETIGQKTAAIPLKELLIRLGWKEQANEILEYLDSVARYREC